MTRCSSKRRCLVEQVLVISVHERFKLTHTGRNSENWNLGSTSPKRQEVKLQRFSPSPFCTRLDGSSSDESLESDSAEESIFPCTVRLSPPLTPHTGILFSVLRRLLNPSAVVCSLSRCSCSSVFMASRNRLALPRALLGLTSMTSPSSSNRKCIGCRAGVRDMFRDALCCFRRFCL